MQEARIIPTFDCGHHRLSVDINPTIDQDLSYCVHQDQPKATFFQQSVLPGDSPQGETVRSLSRPLLKASAISLILFANSAARDDVIPHWVHL